MLLEKENLHTRYMPSDILRRSILSWIISAAAEYALASFPLEQVRHIGQMSMTRMILIIIPVFSVLNLVNLFLDFRKAERILILPAFLALWIPALITSFRVSFLVTGLLIFVWMIPYVLFGQDQQAQPVVINKKRCRKIWIILVFLAAAAFFLFVSIWTVARVMTFSSPSYDFGIFSQMFHYMKTTGLPYTTLERDGLLSHFHVHVSLVYYLLLPVYWLFPYPVTLQILQAAVLGSAVIPLWLIAKNQGLSSPFRCGLCFLLLLYPAYSGGTGYDIHENAFLTPLLLWLFYGIDKRCGWLTALAGALTLLVKEDAAVYVAVIGLWLMIRSITQKKTDWRNLVTGFFLLIGAIGWFLLVTDYLTSNGQGVMTYRYSNMIADGSGSLVKVVQTVFLCPMKAVYECIDPEKLDFIAATMLPLLGIPFITRHYERMILLIPYLLVNLISDYRYQHDIFFQYTFGSTAFIIYLTAVNIRDLSKMKASDLFKAGPLVLALTASCVFFGKQVVPTALYYPNTYRSYETYYANLRQLLDTIPEDASVSATTFYTSYLSQRDIIYDIRYSSREHTLSTDYIVINPKASSCLEGYRGYEAFVETITQHGYILVEKGSGVEIYKKQVG